MASESAQPDAETSEAFLHPGSALTADQAFDQVMREKCANLTRVLRADLERATQEMRFDDASKASAQIIAISTKMLGENHWRVIGDQLTDQTLRQMISQSGAKQLALIEAKELRQVALAASQAGKVAIAEEMFQSAIAKYAESVGTESYLYSNIKLDFAYFLYLDKRYGEACKLCDKHVPLIGAQFGENSPARAAGLELQGIVHLESGRVDEGTQFLNQCAEIREGHFGRGSLDYIKTQRAQVRVAVAKGEFQTALRQLEEILAFCKKNPSHYNLLLTNCMVGMAEIKLRQHDFAGALPLISDALRDYETYFPTDSVWIAQLLEMKSQALSGMNDLPAAKMAAERAQSIRLK